MNEERSGDMEARIADLETKLRRNERRDSIETAFWALMHNVFPDETRKHMKAAGREQLLAARAYLDHWINKMEESSTSEPQEREKITVE